MDAGVVLANSNLQSAQMQNAFLKDANFRQADLSGANLIGANLIDADLSFATVDENTQCFGCIMSNDTICPSGQCQAVERNCGLF